MTDLSKAYDCLLYNLLLAKLLFSYCPVVWIFHRQKLDNLINRLHGRALRVIYRDFNSSFGELLRRDSSTTLHQRYLQELMTEVFKVKTDIAPELMKGLFEFTDVPYNLRNQSKFNLSIPRAKRYGIQTTSSIGPKLWAKVPTEIKDFTY